MNLVFIWFCFHTLKVKIKWPTILGKRFNTRSPWLISCIGVFLFVCFLFFFSFLPDSWVNTFLILLNPFKFPACFSVPFIHHSLPSFPFIHSSLLLFLPLLTLLSQLNTLVCTRVCKSHKYLSPWKITAMLHPSQLEDSGPTLEDH